MPSCTEVAADWLATCPPVPPEVMDETRLRLLDSLGLMLAAAPTRFGAAMRAGALALGDGGTSRLIPFGDRAAPDRAALCNGALAQALQFDDTHIETIIHLSSPNVAAALALGEAMGASGRAVLEAIARGSEITCRFGLAAPGQFHRRGFHPTGLFGTFGAAATAAQILGLSAPAMVSAFGIAGSFASGILECWTDGSDTQFVHPGWSAQAGIRAALLARAGIIGPSRVLEGRLGFYASHVQDPGVAIDIGRINLDLGGVWVSRASAFKPYPCAHVIHPFLDALLALRCEHGLDATHVGRIECRVAAYMMGVVCEPRAEKLAPTNDVRARVSLPWSMAEAMVMGRLGADAFQPGHLADPRIRDLAGRVTCVVDPTAPGTERYQGWVVVETMDGHHLERLQHDSHGSPADPMTAAEIEAKFRENAARVLPAPSAAAIIDAVARLGAAPSLTPLLDLCTA